jgi:hypothetical protein
MYLILHWNHKCNIVGNGFVWSNNAGSIHDNKITNSQVGGNGLADHNSDTVSNNTVMNTEIGQSGFCFQNHGGTFENNIFTDCTYLLKGEWRDSIGVNENISGKIINNSMLNCRVYSTNEYSTGITWRNGSAGHGLIQGNNVTFAMWDGNTPSQIGVGCCAWNVTNDSTDQQTTICDNHIDGKNAVFIKTGFVLQNYENANIDDNKVENITTYGSGFCDTNYGNITDNKVSNCTSSGVGFVRANYRGATILNDEIVNPTTGLSGCTYENDGVIKNTHVYSDGTDNDGDNDIYSKCRIGIQNTANNTSCAGFCQNNYGTIAGCSFEGEVYGSDRADGFFDSNGMNSSDYRCVGTINQCYANAKLYQTGASKVKTNANTISTGCYGFGAVADAGSITECFSIATMANNYDLKKGKVSDQPTIAGKAGFLGSIQNNVTVTDCYSMVCDAYGTGQKTSQAVTQSGNDPFVLYNTQSITLTNDYFWNGNDQKLKSSCADVQGINSQELTAKSSNKYMTAKSYSAATQYPYPGVYMCDDQGNKTNALMDFYGCWPVDSSADTSGDGSDSGNEKTLIEKIEASSTELPEVQGNDTYSVEQGKVYTYQKKYYVSLNNKQITQYNKAYPETDNGRSTYVEFNPDTARVFTSKDLQPNSGGPEVLKGVSRGDLYLTDDGKVYIYKNDYPDIAAPTGYDTDKWPEIILN